MLRVLLIVLLSLRAEAGIVYHYTTTFESSLRQARMAGRVWLDGQRQRVELDPNPENPRTFDVSISEDGGKTSTMINLQNKTYFRSDDPAQPKGVHDWSTILSIPSAQLEKLDKVIVRPLPPVDAETIVGRPAKRHELQFSYRVRARLGGEKIEVSVEGTIIQWVVADVSVNPERPSLVSGFPEVDARIIEWQANVGPGVVRQDISRLRTFKGGKPIRESTSFVIDEIDERSIEPARFKIPTGLTYQLPVLGVPGGS